MDYQTITQRLGLQIRDKRVNRGLTQAQLAHLAGLTRQKVVAVEKGSGTVSVTAYARALGALDCELRVIPAVMPTLDDVKDLFE
ncbi:helix-turn-helix transcriptional regulator [Pseudomonas batumici]|uniref:Putative transcriptional regulator n=1 Tax=Pseudomonas batumici TaxID=226910 RepID=A0A0C2IEG7_9PSED|nr:helix-turn-helix domain-containing protein [Pseudomonas batumici]KIH85360.1 putative transcriptional regulator [Pseudomonas batumici]